MTQCKFFSSREENVLSIFLFNREELSRVESKHRRCRYFPLNRLAWPGLPCPGFLSVRLLAVATKYCVSVGWPADRSVCLSGSVESKFLCILYSLVASELADSFFSCCFCWPLLLAHFNSRRFLFLCPGLFEASKQKPPKLGCVFQSKIRNQTTKTAHLFFDC